MLRCLRFVDPRQSRIWALPLLLFAVVALLLQPTACALWRVHGGGAEHVDAAKQLVFVPPPIEELSGPEAAHNGRGAPPCCRAMRLTDDTAPLPAHQASLHFDAFMAVLPLATTAVELAVATAPPAATRYEPPGRVLPYHSRSERLLL